MTMAFLGSSSRSMQLMAMDAAPSLLRATIRARVRSFPASAPAPTRTLHQTSRVRSMGPAAVERPVSAAAPQHAQGQPLSRAREAMEERKRRMYRERSERHRSVLMYGAATTILALGVTYAAVPLYRAFCSATGFSGTPITDPTRFTADRLYTSEESRLRKRITVHFEATASDELKWKFTPQQKYVKVLPGETALAFYTAENWGTEDVIGIATYNTTPAKMAPYFAKIECFCFEQQKIRAGEQVDLPVFFFIDRDIVDEPQLDGVDDVVLSYTFFKARRNKQGHLEPDAAHDVVQKATGFGEYESVPAK